VTVTGYAPDDLTPARPDGSGSGIPARRTAFDDLADQAARLPWCWPALVTLAFGFYQVGRPELWRDELASWSFASRPVTEMISAARHTGATQLAYYLLLHVWIVAFGDSADAMRALSVLAMAAAAACVALVGRRLAGARAGLLAGLVFALVPSVSRFAQEVRFYALATLATLLLLLRALDRPSALRWLAYAASLALLGYVDVVALSVLAGHAVGAVLRSRHHGDRRQLWFIPAVVAGLAACLPVVLAGSAQAGRQVAWILRPGLDLTDFAFFGRNLFYSTSVAAALIILAVLPGRPRRLLRGLRERGGLRRPPGTGRRRHRLSGQGTPGQLADGRLRPPVLPGQGHAERGAGSARALHRAHRGRGRHPVSGALRAAGGLPGCRTEDLGHRRRPPDEAPTRP
jgi:hypothetical protein